MKGRSEQWSEDRIIPNENSPELQSWIYMQALAEKINGIEQKVRQLAAKLEQVQKENAAYKEENRKLRTDLAVIMEKESQIQPSKVVEPPNVVVKNGGEPVNSKKLRKEIDQYIKEINKCIEWLQDN